MLKVGITGHSGFIGTHLLNTLGLYPEKYEAIGLNDRAFGDGGELRSCDVVVHLAAVNRHSDPETLYAINTGLVEKLAGAMEAMGRTPYVIFASSLQEAEDNAYGRSKADGRRILEEWAARNNARLTSLIIPNVFGPFARPGHNSFVATFCHMLTRGETPELIENRKVRLVYIDNLVSAILGKIDVYRDISGHLIETEAVADDFEAKVSEVSDKLKSYKTLYFDRGIIPELKNRNEVNLFNTFRSYIDHASRFPVRLAQRRDGRGTFVETIRSGAGGQVSFSTTLPGVTRGNHMHTRKIERFTVIRGKALIKLRRAGSDHTVMFELDGAEPSYVDIPVWHAHSLTNTGDGELYTQFWTNEFYDPADPDTWSVRTDKKHRI